MAKNQNSAIPPALLHVMAEKPVIFSAYFTVMTLLDNNHWARASI